MKNIYINRYLLKNSTTGEIFMKLLDIRQEAYQSNIQDSVSLAKLEVQEKLSLLKWFANENMKLGCKIDFVVNKSREGFQFIMPQIALKMTSFIDFVTRMKEHQSNSFYVKGASKEALKDM